LQKAQRGRLEKILPLIILISTDLKGQRNYKGDDGKAEEPEKAAGGTLLRW
jgi:hypothetical protein